MKYDSHAVMPVQAFWLDAPVHFCCVLHDTILYQICPLNKYVVPSHVRGLSTIGYLPRPVVDKFCDDSGFAMILDF